MSLAEVERENAALKAANRELKNRVKVLETIVDSLSEGVVATNLEGEFLVANPIAQEIVGMGPTENAPETWSETYGTFYPDKTTLFPSTELPLYKAMQGETTNDVELVIRHQGRPDGVAISVSGRPLYDETGTLMGGVIAMRDITEVEQVTEQLKATVNQLQRQNTLMDIVFNNIGDGVFVVSKEGAFLFYNPIAQEIIGMGPTEDAPEAWSDTYGIFYPDKVTPFPATELPIYKAMHGKIPDDEALFVRNPNRPEGVFITGSARPLYDETGDLIGGVGVFRDLTKLKRTQDQLEATVNDLQVQNSLMDAILDSLSEGVVVANKEGEFLFFNPIAQEIVGIGPTEGSPEAWSETYGSFYPDTVTPFPSTELSLYKAIHGEMTNHVEVFIRNPNRPEGVSVSVSGRPLKDKAGELIGGVIAFRDITELKRTQDQLEASVNDLQAQNSLMDAVFNGISDGIIVANHEGNYVLFNKTVKAVLGAGIEDVHTSQAPEKFGLFHPETGELYPVDELPIARALRGEHADDIEILIRNQQLPEEIYTSISGRPIYDEKGRVNGAVAAIRDVSQFKQAEARLEITNDQLEVQTQLLHSIFHAISDGVVVAGETSNIIMANLTAKRILGPIPLLKSSDEWFKPDLYFYPDKVTPFPLEEHPIFKAIWGKSTDGVEMFVQNDENPEGVYVSVSGRPLQDNDGNWRGGVAVFHDLTERVKTEEALAQAFTQGRLEIVDTVLHNIGNAINSVSVGIDTIHHQIVNDRLTPRLTALANALEQHQDDFSDYVKNDPQGQKVLPFILTLAQDFNVVKDGWESTVQRIRDRTRHIVDIIRTQNSYNADGSGNRKDINLADAISQTIKIVRDMIDKREIQIEMDWDNAPEEIRIQESQFHQMLINLIKNAIDAIDDSAKLEDPPEEPRIQLRVYADQDFVYIDVTDNGIGIAPENMSKIFSAGYTTKERGNGLGLHSSANFVINSGGRIEPFSDGIGKGATMRVVLRRASIEVGDPEV